MEKKQLVEKVLELDNKDLAVLLINYYYDMEKIKDDMVSCLNMLDELAEGTNKDELKNQIRKKILDNFNELPRSTYYLNFDIVKILKEE